MKVGNVVECTVKCCCANGGGDAGIKENGDMSATSVSGGSAVAIHSIDRLAWNFWM